MTAVVAAALLASVLTASAERELLGSLRRIGARAGRVWNETWAPETWWARTTAANRALRIRTRWCSCTRTLADEGSNWVTLAPLLANEGYCVYAFNYGETLASLPLILFITPGRIDGLGHIENSAEELVVVREQRALENESVEGRPRRPLPGRDDAQLLPQVPGRRRPRFTR